MIEVLTELTSLLALAPSASGARGLVRGRVFTQGALLVASTAQEGLIRKH